MSLNDFLKGCITRPDGRLLCWDYDTKQCVVVELKKTAVSLADLTEEEILSLKKRISADTPVKRKKED